jgi:hypothetical protein
VTAAGIGPQPATVVFSACPLLQHELSLGVENQDGKSPVQETKLMSSHFFFLPDGTVLRIDEDEGI